MGEKWEKKHKFEGGNQTMSYDKHRRDDDDQFESVEDTVESESKSKNKNENYNYNYAKVIKSGNAYVNVKAKSDADVEDVADIEDDEDNGHRDRHSRKKCK
ncbi:hypothetical protein [Terribacillus sp. 7520-G]|uniref:hypothetical protein n=1 Tax=Terribacillus TaxID=459532 RepID=UPI000BA50F37|nr:hypothetical protein [Terribacillus sp. 7520-G]PAD38572.1 hypothetical protein CHH53_10080 [Terribacillus sp. 7520-G]